MDGLGRRGGGRRLQLQIPSSAPSAVCRETLVLAVGAGLNPPAWAAPAAPAKQEGGLRPAPTDKQNHGFRRLSIRPDWGGGQTFSNLGSTPLYCGVTLESSSGVTNTVQRIRLLASGARHYRAGRPGASDATHPGQVSSVGGLRHTTIAPESHDSILARTPWGKTKRWRRRFGTASPSARTNRDARQCQAPANTNRAPSD